MSLWRDGQEGRVLVVGLVVNTSSCDLDAPSADGDSITVVVGGRKDYCLDDSREDYADIEGHFENVVESFACGVISSGAVTVWPG